MKADDRGARRARGGLGPLLLVVAVALVGVYFATRRDRIPEATPVATHDEAPGAQGEIQTPARVESARPEPADSGVAIRVLPPGVDTQPEAGSTDVALTDEQRRLRDERVKENDLLASAGQDPPASADDLAFFRRVQHYDVEYNGRTTVLRALGEQHPEPVRSATGDSPKLEVWTDSPRAYTGASMRFHARLVDAQGAAVHPDTVEARLSIDGSPPSPVAISPAGDEYTGTIEFPADLPRRPTQSSALLAVHTAGDTTGTPFERDGAIGFTINYPEGKLVRLENPRIADGDLLIDAVLDVQLGGRWYVYAELAGPHGEPVASARARESLEPGTQTVTLFFGGQVIRDQDIPGPYRVHLARATRVEVVPPNETDPLLDALVTPAWRATEFH